MASTVFVDGATPVVASWLNDVNNLVYNGIFVSTANINLSGNLSVAGTSNLLKNVIIGAPTSGVPLTVNGISGYDCGLFQGNFNGTVYLDVYNAAVSASSVAQLICKTGTPNSNLSLILGDGNGSPGAFLTAGSAVGNLAFRAATMSWQNSVGSQTYGSVNANGQWVFSSTLSQTLAMNTVVTASPANLDVEAISTVNNNAAITGLTFSGSDPRLYSFTITPTNQIAFRAYNPAIYGTNSTTVVGPSGGVQLQVGTTAHNGIYQFQTTDGGAAAFYLVDSSTTVGYFGTTQNIGIGLVTNNNQRIGITNAGNVNVSAPSSGISLTVAPAAGAGPVALQVIGGPGTNSTLFAQIWNNSTNGSSTLQLVSATANSYFGLGIVDNSGSPYAQLSTGSAVLSTYFAINGHNYLQATAAGNVTVPAPTSGVGLTVNGVSGSAAISTSTTGSNIQGWTDGSNAAAGNIGEYIESHASAVAVAPNTQTTITSISLTAGDWDVHGSFASGALGTTNTGFTAGINTTAATLPSFNYQLYQGTPSSSTPPIGPVPSQRFTFATTTTVYLVGEQLGAGTNASCGGQIWARRRR